MGAWIEILEDEPTNEKDEVALFMGAWIEIYK